MASFPPAHDHQILNPEKDGNQADNQHLASAGDAKQSDNQRRKLIKLVSAGSALAAGATLNLTPAISSAQENRTRYGIVGQTAPELEVDVWRNSADEKTDFSIIESRGKWVFLKCWQAWCPGCHSSGFPTLQAMQKAFFGHPKVEIAAIQTVFEGFGTNTEDKLAEMRERYALKIRMGHDTGKKSADDHRPSTMRLYRTGGTPWLILIRPDGKVVFNDFHVNTEKLIEYVQEQIA